MLNKLNSIAKCYKLNTIEVLIFRVLFDSYISHDYDYYIRLKKTLVYIKNNLINSDGNIYLTVNSSIEINNVITDSNNITLGKTDVKAHLTEDKIYQIMDYYYYILHL